jgi:triosephosphate isomerase
VSKRVPVIAGNWKMYKSVAQTVDFFEKFRPLVTEATHCEIVIAPPFPCLAAAVEATRGTRIRIGAQNVFWECEGAYTGEVCASMLVAAGCSHVIIGHSERRQYFHETNETVARRLAAALAAELVPIVCIGERLEEREAGRTEAVLIEQFEGAFAALTPAQFSPILVAYEPVWAIGTGRTATPEIAAEAHRLIRDRAARRFGAGAAEALRILYGGSVKPDNIKGLMARPEIDGALVGGASLDPKLMASIVNF